ncbi:Methyltransferase domain-containing protein [Pseudomonas guineae]|uniref:Methyltransferase domain-containing protein n=1 Tax=Pseudomonas guineae TaxID=425504 RepID=A0A1I3D0K8_9PSED|nr:methyltransferase domain-containing protein [Pseudomonas guineae]SFH80156.1 Methyltransferase domain-containing protein [Pseudomonas guineae]
MSDVREVRLDWGLHSALKLVSDYEFESVLDIGSGDGLQKYFFEMFGKKVFSVDMNKNADFVGDFLEIEFERSFDVIWCSHVLEHQRNVGLFLEKIFTCLKEDGVLVIVVPIHPRERLIAGHLTSWNSGLLCYNLILAGFDCSEAALLQNFELGCILKKRPVDIDAAYRRAGSGADVTGFYQLDPFEVLKDYFPFPVAQGANAEVLEHGWGGTNYNLPLPLHGESYKIIGRFVGEDGVLVKV